MLDTKRVKIALAALERSPDSQWDYETCLYGQLAQLGHVEPRTGRSADFAGKQLRDWLGCSLRDALVLQGPEDKAEKRQLLGHLLGRGRAR